MTNEPISHYPKIWKFWKANRLTHPYITTWQLSSRAPEFDTKWVRLVPNGTNPGFFQIRFSTFWLYVLKLIWKKIPGFVPLGANLIHFESKSDHPAFKTICLKVRRRHSCRKTTSNLGIGGIDGEYSALVTEKIARWGNSIVSLNSWINRLALSIATIPGSRVSWDFYRK